jgi:hypothetical protein
MDIVALTAMLAPAMPFLVKGGEKLAEKLGTALFETTKKIWGLLGDAITKRPAAQEAVEDLAAAPDDADAQAALRNQLKKIFEVDAELAKQINELMQQAGPSIANRAELHGSGAIAQGDHTVAAGKGGVAVGGNVNGGIKLGGGSDKD